MLKVKPYKEKPGMCGPACLKMVLQYFGRQMSEQRLAKLCGWTKAKGVKSEAVLKVAKGLGFQGFIKDFATVSDLWHYVLKKKIPVIVDWFSRDDGHSSVVVNINRENIYLLDPEFGLVRSMKLGIFKRVWFDFPGDYIKTKRQLIIRRMMVIY